MTSGRRGMGAIGAGFMGPLHARLWSRLPNTRLVAIADPDERTAKSVADDLGVARYRDSASLLERDDIDAVSIVTPDRLHAAAHRTGWGSRSIFGPSAIRSAVWPRESARTHPSSTIRVSATST